MKSYLLISLFGLLFVGCANIEVGFEEDSPFYSKPNVQEVEINHLNKNKINTLEIKTDKLSTNIRKTNDKDENETTFYYEFVEE